jgi:hypothetical protein
MMVFGRVAAKSQRVSSDFNQRQGPVSAAEEEEKRATGPPSFGTRGPAT